MEPIERNERTYQEERYYSSTFVLNPPRKPLNSIRQLTQGRVNPRTTMQHKMDHKMCHTAELIDTTGGGAWTR